MKSMTIKNTHLLMKKQTMGSKAILGLLTILLAEGMSRAGAGEATDHPSAKKQWLSNQILATAQSGEL